MTSLYERARLSFDRNDLDGTFAALNAAMGSSEVGNPDVFALLGETLLKIGSGGEAAEAFEEASKRGGAKALDWQKRAIDLYASHDNIDRAFLLALQYQKSRPDDADISALIVRQLRDRGQTDLIGLFVERLVASDNPDHLKLASELIGDDSRNPLNLQLFAKLSKLKPDDPYPRFKYYSVAREFCDFAVLDEADRFVRRSLTKGDTGIFEGDTPYSNLLHCPDEKLNRLATNNRDIQTPPPPGLAEKRRARPHAWQDKLRVGYLSADIWDDHATMRLFMSVLENHDRNQFDITMYDYTPERFVAFDTGGRGRWQPIVSLTDLDDDAAAAKIRAEGCDILVDLKGHTGGSRSRILNRMVAPIQVSWLGFPGTVVNIDLDYVIGDRIVLPDTSRPHYHEKFCRLPGSYQPNDPVHRPLPDAQSRAALGLPENAFVFASFNAGRKITPQIADLWAEIIRQSENAVLWIMLDHPLARQNFLTRMAKNGVENSKIIFAPKTDYASHVARLRAADLGLDTYPYNGHTTTSDKLWAGLPVLTLKGRNFASRVSESLLNAAGLPELVADSPETLFSTALDLVTHPEKLSAYRHHLETHRGEIDLFDHKAFTAKLERAYQQMAMRAKQGLPPEHIDID